ncbi:hypothetical protein F5050DRAFT_1802381 [Lentinula boryana]|uniref:Uncharacterized protein n=1 Tax=Lentinula boryana TaxID=40481 RepID=A0ABQ8QV63_9AGAR|nr:hypothetical protein F5050DRAFT_1802381 [Lentinula boryana]
MRFFIVFTTLLLSTAIAFPIPGDGKSPVHDADVALRDISSKVHGSEGRIRQGRDVPVTIQGGGDRGNRPTHF